MQLTRIRSQVTQAIAPVLSLVLLTSATLAKADLPQSVQDLSKKAPAELDRLFERAPSPTQLPSGFFVGTHVIPADTKARVPRALVSTTMNFWKGKQFSSEKAVLEDSVQGDVFSTKAKLYIAPIAPVLEKAFPRETDGKARSDGRASLITDYNAYSYRNPIEAFAFRDAKGWIDEFREVSPGLLLGRSYYRGVFWCHVILAQTGSPSIVPKAEELTVWKLKDMAEKGDFKALNYLFNHGINLKSLPEGYAAGTGARVFNLPVGTQAIDALTGENWRGKIFFASENPRESHGLNRIKTDILKDSAPIVPMAAFTTKLLDKVVLAPEATSNLVILNYAQPMTKGYWQERTLKQVQVYDVMVAVQGKYGPVFIGKTWLGTYDRNGVFHAFNPNQLIAWYFLDFNEEALKEQKKNHWDGEMEETIRWN